MTLIPSGSEALDVALGGGYPYGRLVEVYGPKGSGKRELALHAVGTAQSSGGVVAYIDAEHAFDANRSQAIGIDLARLLVSQPDTAGQALDIVEALARSGAVDLIVVASVACLTPDADDVGLQSRLLSQAMQKLTATAHRTGAAVILLNDRPTTLFDTEPGSNAVRFYASIRMDVTRQGDAIKVKIVKNKLAMPFQEAEVRWPPSLERENGNGRTA